MNYKKLYGFDGRLDDYVFESDSPTYVFGLDNAKELKSSKAK